MSEYRGSVRILSADLGAGDVGKMFTRAGRFSGAVGMILGAVMGASAWSYVVRYEPDLGHALVQLRHRVFADGDFVSPGSQGLPEPASLDELMSEPYWEFLGTCGTHSILDIAAGIDAGGNAGTRRSALSRC